MDEYTRLKKALEAYFEMPDVELTDEQMSVYDLHRIVDTKLEELRKIQIDSNFVKEVNKGLVFRKIGGVFRQNKTSSQRECLNIRTESDGQTSEIVLEFSYKKSAWGHYYLHICKDVDSDQIYFKDKMADKDFVARYYDQINEIFSVLEEFSNLYQRSIGRSGIIQQQVFSDHLLKVALKYDAYGRTNIFIGVKEKADPQQIYKRGWFERQTLADFVEENREVILKKIPVDISRLDYTTKTIVGNYTSKMNIPVLAKKK